ncbi:MAG: GyrI-like domain-containing protein [Anaerolineae bacterium]
MDVRIVELEPLHVASALAYGAEPEMKALQTLFTWAKPRHLLEEPHRIFGFNNPSPTAGSPNYGYEVWLTVEPGVQAEAPITLRSFAGGKYAVTRVVGVEHIAATWMELVKWGENSPYQRAEHQWLEEHVRVGDDVPPEEMVLDLYMPIRSQAE